MFRRKINLEKPNHLYPDPGHVSNPNPDSNIPNPDYVNEENTVEEAKSSLPNPEYVPTTTLDNDVPNPNNIAKTNLVEEEAKPSLPNPGYVSKPNPDNNFPKLDHPNDDDTSNPNIVIDTNVIEENKPSLPNTTKYTLPSTENDKPNNRVNMNVDKLPDSENATTPNPDNDTPSPNIIDGTNPSKESTKNYLTCEEFKTKIFKNVFETKGIKELNKIQVVNLIMKEILKLEHDYDTSTTRAYLGSDEFMKQLLKNMYQKRNETEDTFAQTVQEIAHLDETYQKKSVNQLSSDGKPNPGGINVAKSNID